VAGAADHGNVLVRIQFGVTGAQHGSRDMDRTFHVGCAEFPRSPHVYQQ